MYPKTIYAWLIKEAQGLSTAELSKESELSERIIRMLKSGHTTNPQLETFDKLFRGVERIKKKQARERNSEDNR